MHYQKRHHGHHVHGGHHGGHHHNHNKGHKKHHTAKVQHVQVHPVQMMEALSAYNNSGGAPAVDFVIKENVIAAAHAAAQQQNVMQQSEHNRQLDLHLAAISRIQQR